MKMGLVYHRNWIEEEINESYNNHPDTSNGYSGRMVYCKRRHAVIEPMEEDCNGCPHFAGFMQGYGHECAWEDTMTEGDSKDINWVDRNKELLRVSQLIDDGFIKKG